MSRCSLDTAKNIRIVDIGILQKFQHFHPLSSFLHFLISLSSYLCVAIILLLSQYFCRSFNILRSPLYVPAISTISSTNFRKYSFSFPIIVLPSFFACCGKWQSLSDSPLYLKTTSCPVLTYSADCLNCV